MARYTAKDANGKVYIVNSPNFERHEAAFNQLFDYENIFDTPEQAAAIKAENAALREERDAVVENIIEKITECDSEILYAMEHKDREILERHFKEWRGAERSGDDGNV